MRHHLIGKQVYVLWVLQALDHPGNHSLACRINRHVELPEVFGNPLTHFRDIAVCYTLST
jgi:hypothetical protein